MNFKFVLDTIIAALTVPCDDDFRIGQIDTAHKTILIYKEDIEDLAKMLGTEVKYSDVDMTYNNTKASVEYNGWSIFTYLNRKEATDAEVQGM